MPIDLVPGTPGMMRTVGTYPRAVGTNVPVFRGTQILGVGPNPLGALGPARFVTL
jgi:hypothetical protein